MKSAVDLVRNGTEVNMAEKNVIEVKALLSRAVKAMEEFDSVDEGGTSTAKPIASTTNQYAGTGYKAEMERLFPNLLRHEEAFE